jgi:hypothetical protein
MKRTIFVYTLLAAIAAALGAQASQPSPYEGTSSPPPDDTITTPEPQSAPLTKPSAGKPAYAQPNARPQSALADPSLNYPAASAPDDGTDNGIVEVAPGAPAQPSLNQRASLGDPDGDIVHPAPLPSGTLGEGTTIRVRLLGRLSTVDSQSGDRFRTRVASDVVQDGQILIPTGAEINGAVVQVSSGHAGGHGSMRLRPETVILADGSRFRLYAQTTGAPGSRSHVGSEGAITPGSRLKKDGIEYGAAVGGGAVTGAILGGPGGALAGTIIGAGVITAHLLISHPQATLENGTVLLFTLSEPLNLVPVAPTGN